MLAIVCVQMACSPRKSAPLPSAPRYRAAALHAPKLPHLPNAGEPGNFDLVSVSQ